VEKDAVRVTIKSMAMDVLFQKTEWD